MNKFAVTPAAQGEGLGAALWEQISVRYPQLYWRSRADNPVNTWYNRQADFRIRSGEWQVFGYGIDDFSLIEALVNNAQSRKEYWVKDAK